MPKFIPLPINQLYLSHTLSEPAFGEGGTVFYVRMADGRRTIVRQSLASGLAQVVATEPAPAGTVGYGGGVFAVHRDSLVYAGKDCRLWAIDLSSGQQWAVTPAFEGLASPSISPDGRFVAFVVELDRHADVLLADLRGSSLPVKLSDSPAFANHPSFSPDGSRVVWQEWGEYDMPWDQAWLRVARLARPTPGATAAHELLPVSVSTLKQDRVSHSSPQFSPDGKRLAYTSDESGWRSLWVADADAQGGARIDAGEGEIGFPDWIQRRVSVRWSPTGNCLYALRRRDSQDSLLRVAWPEMSVDALPTGFTTLDDLSMGSDERGNDRWAYAASTPAAPHAIVVRSDGHEVSIATFGVGLIDPESLSVPDRLSWATSNGETTHGLLYPAVGPEARSGPRPLMVMIHGGPTSEVSNGWNAQAQYFATRGWHYLCVNHRGGTGRGRAYQDKLNGRWGVVDVEDARSGAEHLVERGLADPLRLVITGGSAGGYTTLMALVKQPDFWRAGVTLYPVGELYELKRGAHRFEANYEETLIGRLPEAGALWKERSPLTHAKNTRAPLLVFHGKEDKAVPHQQSVDFVSAAQRAGAVAELVSYGGEGHGFVKESTRRDVIERMERFLDKYVICHQ